MSGRARAVSLRGLRLGLLLAVLPLGSASANGQGPPETDVEAIRAYLVDALQRNRELDVAYVRAMPDSAWRWAPARGVRDFAQQMAHVTHDFFGPWRDDAGPSADSAAYLNDPDMMVIQIEEGYDWAIARFRDMSAEDLTEPRDFGLARPLPPWRAGAYWIEHAMWTRGSVVPYLRAQGVTPPQIRFFGR